jgi:deazaflavin-dependent oxidoreductase (nitroreductase family)
MAARRDRPRKRRLEILGGRFFVNPMVRGLFRAGISPPRTLLLETVGRRSGAIRHTPLNYMREGDRIWVLAQHSTHAGWVRNMQARPQVRVRIGRTWHDAVGSLQPEDDVRARARSFANGPVGRMLAVGVMRALESDPVSVALDLR